MFNRFKSSSLKQKMCKINLFQKYDHFFKKNNFPIKIIPWKKNWIQYSDNMQNSIIQPNDAVFTGIQIIRFIIFFTDEKNF